MQSEDRPIHFTSELRFSPRAIEKPALQKLYYELSQRQGLDYDQSQFAQIPLARFFSQRASKAQSMFVVMPDRIGLMEEWVDITMAQFIDKVRAGSDLARDELGIDAYRSQSVIIRTTYSLTNFEDNRVFLIDHVCNQHNRIGQFFRRPLATGGLRFMLPATPEHPGTLHILVEPFRNSLREIYVEVKGVFTDQHTPLQEPDSWEQHIRLCRDFIQESIFPFVNQYDTPQS